MKKVFAVVLSGVILCSSFCGCGKKKAWNKDLNQEWYEKTKGYYDSIYPEGRSALWLYADGVRGNGTLNFMEKTINFAYTTCDGQDLDINISLEKNTVSLTMDLVYGDERFYVSGYDYPIGMKDIEKNIDDMIAGTPDTFTIYSDSALATHGEDVKKDIAIMYARLIAMSDNAFPELNLTMEDSGIDLGDKYRSVDPTDSLSMEIVITNEHKFEKGICSDCGMVWTEYFYDTIHELDEYGSEDWSSVYGQRTDSMINGVDYVQYISHGKDMAELLYHPLGDSFQISNDCSIMIYDTGDGIDVSIEFSLEEGKFELEGQSGVYADRFRYYLTVSAAPGEYDKVFASKEAFIDAVEAECYISDPETHTSIDAWEELTEEEIKKMIEDVDDCVYYTKDDVIDLVWERHENFLESLDRGMIWLDTSFEDIGINWKG